jgi:serine/threonine protein kinase
MAPEQIEGHPRAASDQYALGVVVYEWLCGSRPFEGSVTEVMVQHMTMPPSPLHERVPTISAEVEQVVLQALAKDPNVRFASVQEFATAFEQSAPGPTAAPSYATVAVVPNQPAAPTEATPSADLPEVPRDPTALPGSSVPHAITTPQSQCVGETPLSGQIVVPTAAFLPSPLEPTLPVQRKARHPPRITAGLPSDWWRWSSQARSWAASACSHASACSAHVAFPRCHCSAGRHLDSRYRYGSTFALSQLG